MARQVNVLFTNWRPFENKEGELYDAYEVGKSGILSIFEDEDKSYLVTYTNGVQRRVFNPNYVEYGEIDNALKVYDTFRVEIRLLGQKDATSDHVTHIDGEHLIPEFKVACGKYVNGVQQHKYDSKFTPPFRVGKKSKRAVLDANGREVVVFPNSDVQAQLYCDYLNNDSL